MQVRVRIREVKVSEEVYRFDKEEMAEFTNIWRTEEGTTFLKDYNCIHGTVSMDTSEILAITQEEEDGLDG